MSRLVPLLLLPLLAAGAVRADIYQWTDANGRVHFGDRAPASGAASRTPAVLPDKSASAPPETSTATPDGASQRELVRERQERQRRLTETMRLEREEKQRAEARRQEQANKSAEDCARLREHIARMDGRRVYMKDANGDKQYLDDSQRATHEARARQYLQENCQ